jgi:hypothetical protein
MAVNRFTQWCGMWYALGLVQYLFLARSRSAWIRASRMSRNGGWRVFLAGVLCGIIFMTVVGAASVWWKSRPERSAKDDAIYDMCLIGKSGNTVACDALMRTLDRANGPSKRP